LKRELPNLDLLRSVAVLSVLADHLSATQGLAQRFPVLFDLGYWGVLLFFIHTSLVLMMSLDRQESTGGRLYSTFYVRRMFRIYPLSIVAVLAAAAFHIPRESWGATYTGVSMTTMISNILLCQNLTGKLPLLGPLWSLPFEIQMYVFLPLLYLLVRRCASPKPLFGLWFAAVAAGLLQIWLSHTAIGRHLHVSLLRLATFVPCFLSGVIAYSILVRVPKPKLKAWAWPLAILASTILFLRFQSTAASWYVAWTCCLLLALVLTWCQELSSRWLNRSSHLVAKYSYGLYLAQVPVLWLAFVKAHYLPVPVQWTLFFLLIVAVPVACYHLIEQPFITMGARLSAPREFRPSQVFA
jgi:peptidoglycan/LPS O-acetylase OafA/YrhL